MSCDGKLATDTFHVNHRGSDSVEELAAKLRIKLYETLQLSTLLPGDCIEASRTRPFTIHATAAGVAATTAGGSASAVAAEEAEEDSMEDARAIRLGLLDLRALAVMLATAESPDSELWLRYLQARAPDLLPELSHAPPSSTLDGGPCTSQPSTAPTAERWLAELRGFMRLCWRRAIGGPQLHDGVQMCDLQFGPMLGEGAYGQVFLARHRVLPDRWYAVKRQRLDAKLQTSPRGRRQLRLLEREREVLLLLARESRGKADARGRRIELLRIALSLLAVVAARMLF